MVFSGLAAGRKLGLIGDLWPRGICLSWDVDSLPAFRSLGPFSVQMCAYSQTRPTIWQFEKRIIRPLTFLNYIQVVYLGFETVKTPVRVECSKPNVVAAADAVLF